MSETYRDDLVAQAAAMHAAGFELIWSTPRHETPDARALAKERFVDFRPADFGIADAPLPAFKTMPQFLAVQAAMKNLIEAVVNGAAVVQCGAGGHPMALGQFAWPLIDPKRCKRVFVFASDPLPGRRRAITSGRNPAKRLLKSMAVKKFEAFCRQAVSEADLVFAHDPSVQKQFGKQWNDRCHTFNPWNILLGDCASDDRVAARARRVADAKRPLKLIAMGSLSSTAGIDHLLKALAKARRLGAQWTLSVAGPSNQSQRQLADSSDLGHVVTWNVDWAGEADAADAFIAAPLVPGEIPHIAPAAARGLPVLAYRGGLADETLSEGGGAILVERGETNRLSQALIDLWRDRDRLATLASAALAVAHSRTRDELHRQRAALVRKVIGS